MGRSITAANSIVTLAVDSVFPAPVVLSGYEVDDIFETESIDPVEVKMGVDGLLSGGFVYQPIKMGITLQADSASAFLFDQWYLAQIAASDVFQAFGEIVLPSIGYSWTLNNGFLSTYKPTSDGKRVLQARKFGITFNSIIPQPL